jgi:hypothetical protein
MSHKVAASAAPTKTLSEPAAERLLTKAVG